MEKVIIDTTTHQKFAEVLKIFKIILYLKGLQARNVVKILRVLKVKAFESI